MIEDDFRRPSTSLQRRVSHIFIFYLKILSYFILKSSNDRVSAISKSINSGTTLSFSLQTLVSLQILCVTWTLIAVTQSPHFLSSLQWLRQTHHPTPYIPGCYHFSVCSSALCNYRYSYFPVAILSQMLYTFPVSRTFLDLTIKTGYSAPVPGSINALTF